MKKGFTLFTLIAFLSLGTFSVFAQNDSENIPANNSNTEENKSITDSNATIDDVNKDNKGNSDKGNKPENKKKKEVEEETFHQIIKQKFMEGGPAFMGIVLLCLILGLALAIERIIYLNMATTNSKKLLNKVNDALKSGGVNAAKEVCRNTRGPVASIFYQGLDRSDEGLEQVEKSIVAYGGVQMGLLEKGLSWISLFIALAPMLGFMGTVIGMIGAFDAIEAAGDISPSLVAGGIKVALLTTVFGLIVAMILQVFYNYLISKVDSIVNDMEDASIKLVDILVNNK